MDFPYKFRIVIGQPPDAKKGSDDIVLMKNLRDSSQIGHLGRQIFPGKPKFILEAYEDSCLKVPHGYLMLDLTPQGNEKYRVRTRVFPGEFPTIYLPKS